MGCDAGSGLDMMEGGVNKRLDEGGVMAGRCDADLMDPGRRHGDRYFIFLGAPLGDDNISSLGGIIRECFLFRWTNITESSIGGDALGGLSLVSASFRHRGM